MNSHNPQNAIFISLPPLMTPPNIKMSINTSCGWAYNSAGILPNGIVTVCTGASDEPYFHAGNLKDDTLSSIWENSLTFKRLRKNTYEDLKGICKHCPVKEVCGGCCRLQAYKNTKDVYSSSSLCQDFYDAVRSGIIHTPTFPIGSVSIIPVP